MKFSKGVIYFDGLCYVCAGEINHYRGLAGSEKFQFQDITSTEFNPKLHGLDPAQAHRVMHVRDTEGQLKTGVDAFRAIWKELPRYKFLYDLSSSSLVRTVLEAGYRAFVKIRPLLPRRKADCNQSPFCEIPK